MLSTVDEADSPDFVDALRGMNYICIKLGGGGDGWIDNFDNYLTAEDRFIVRFFARVCRLSLKNFVKMLRLTSRVNVHIEFLRRCGSIEVADLLSKYFMNRLELPSMEEIVGSIAADQRGALPDQSDPLKQKVSIFLHVDEHQSYFKKVNDFYNLSTNEALAEHKKFLYPAMEVMSHGYCGANNVFFFPFFTGVNHRCINALTSLYKLKYIHLHGLSIQGSQDLVEMIYTGRGLSIHPSWLNKNGGKSLAPIDILTMELGGNPRFLRAAHVLFGNSLCTEYSSLILEQQLKKLQER